MDVAFQIASIIMSVVLIVLIMLQVKGGALGSFMGGGEAGGGITRTRRGLEKTLFQVTVGLSVIFLLVSILAVVAFQ